MKILMNEFNQKELEYFDNYRFSFNTYFSIENVFESEFFHLLIIYNFINHVNLFYYSINK